MLTASLKGGDHSDLMFVPKEALYGGTVKSAATPRQRLGQVGKGLLLQDSQAVGDSDRIGRVARAGPVIPALDLDGSADPTFLRLGGPDEWARESTEPEPKLTRRCSPQALSTHVEARRAFHYARCIRTPGRAFRLSEVAS